MFEFVLFFRARVLLEILNLDPLNSLQQKIGLAAHWKCSFSLISTPEQDLEFFNLCGLTPEYCGKRPPEQSEL